MAQLDTFSLLALYLSICVICFVVFTLDLTYFSSYNSATALTALMPSVIPLVFGQTWSVDVPEWNVFRPPSLSWVGQTFLCSSDEIQVMVKEADTNALQLMASPVSLNNRFLPQAESPSNIFITQMSTTTVTCCFYLFYSFFSDSHASRLRSVIGMCFVYSKDLKLVHILLAEFN